MYISRIELVNFRSFKGKETLKFCKGINYFVGNNNCGKTTIFKSVEFLQAGGKKEEWITSGCDKEDVSVKITLKGDDIKSILEHSEKNLKKYLPYVTDNNELILRRSSKTTTWTDGKGKDKEITIKNIAVYSPNNKKYENPAGIDKSLKSLLETQFIYSDLDNDEYQDFGKTKIIGRLINIISEGFQKTHAWTNFIEAHENAFGEEGLSKELDDLENKLGHIMSEQYGETKVEFDFELPSMDSFFKAGQVNLEDHGVKTCASEKGTGMQRALALSLIQVYSQFDNSVEKNLVPILFFLDEPETFLHPKAQDKLLEALEKISKNSQIFITTHSPYLLRNFDNKNNSLKIFSRDENLDRIKDSESLNLFPETKPTWGVINYFAFQVVSEEFHIELFNFLHKTAVDRKEKCADGQLVRSSISSFDNWLNQQDDRIECGDNHIHTFKTRTDKTLTVYIRNYIDHPYTDKYPHEKPRISDIEDSIKFMLKVKNKLQW